LNFVIALAEFKNGGRQGSVMVIYRVIEQYIPTTNTAVVQARNSKEVAKYRVTFHCGTQDNRLQPGLRAWTGKPREAVQTDRTLRGSRVPWRFD
jgi:hypothetical protein